MILLIDSISTPYIDCVTYEKSFFAEKCTIVYRAGIDSVSKEDLAAASIVVVYFGNTLDKRHIDLLDNCKGIIAATAGYNNIDICAADSKGIPVCNIPEYGPDDVADHTMLLILACARRFLSVAESIKKDTWNWHSAQGAQSLRDKKLGIIGLGKIGLAVAKRCLAFGMQIVYYDPYKKQIYDSNIRKISSLEELISEVDILTIHCPLNSETLCLLGEKELTLLKKGSILINTARGDIVDQTALIGLLKTDHLFALGLDVLSNEPEIPDAMLNDSRITLTPHMAFYSQRSLTNIRDLVIRSCINFLNEKGNLNSIIKSSKDILNA